MAISDNLNSIRTHLEDDYIALEQLGVSVEDRNIENIKDMANQIYAKFPKTDYAEGSNITLSNTLKGKLDFEDGIVGYGQTSQEGTPTPDNPQDIEVVRGNVEARIRGKNYAKLDQSINNRNVDITYTENVANSVVGSKTSNNGQFLATFVAQVVSGQTYIISGTATNCNLYAYKETLGGEPFANISSSTLPKSFTSNYTGTIVLGMFFPSAITGTASIKNFQLEEGSSATTYEPYQTPQTYQLSLGEYEFAKIGNYVDTIEYDVDEDKAYKNKAINKYQFTGNENFGKAGSTNLNGYIFNFPSVTTNILPPANNGTKANILSNAFITKAVDTIISEATYGIGIRSDKYLYIGAPLGSFENVSALQTYLANNITFMYYALQTEVKEEITGTLKDQIKALYYSHSFNGTTIIESNGDLPMIIKVRALKGE